MSSLMSPSSSHQLPSYTSPEPSPNSAAIDDLLAEALQQRSKCLARKKLAEERMDQGTAQLYAHQKHHHNLQKQYPKVALALSFLPKICQSTLHAIPHRPHHTTPHHTHPIPAHLTYQQCQHGSAAHYCVYYYQPGSFFMHLMFDIGRLLCNQTNQFYQARLPSYIR